MLTDFEYEILAFVRANRYCAQREIINNFKSQYGCSMAKGVILSLVEKKYLAFDKVHKELNADVTPAGMSAMLAYEEMREQHSKDERDKAFNRKLGILQTLVPFITFVLGALLDHFTGIIGWFGSLF